MFSNMNPTLRGFLIIAAIALVIILLNLYVALASLFLLAQIAFFLAIAFRGPSSIHSSSISCGANEGATSRRGLRERSSRSTAAPC